MDSWWRWREGGGYGWARKLLKEATARWVPTHPPTQPLTVAQSNRLLPTTYLAHRSAFEPPLSQLPTHPPTHPKRSTSSATRAQARHSSSTHPPTHQPTHLTPRSQQRIPTAFSSSFFLPHPPTHPPTHPPLLGLPCERREHGRDPRHETNALLSQRSQPQRCQ